MFSAGALPANHKFRYPSLVPLPEQIPVKYTEEEAEYLSVRPVVRQTFQLAELLDMILGVTGKDPARVRQILRSGTIVFNFYRYWWTGFDAPAEELAAALAKFPDADSARVFRAEECVAVLLVGKNFQPFHSASSPRPGTAGSGQAGQASGHITLPANALELTRAEAAYKRLFSGRSFWDALQNLANDAAPVYLGYSYQRRADIYHLEITPESAAALVRAAEKLAPRSIRAHAAQIVGAARILFLCPRKV